MDFFSKCGSTPSPICNCVAARQTVAHVVEECQLEAYEDNHENLVLTTSEAAFLFGSVGRMFVI